MFHKREIRDEPLCGVDGVTSYINEDSCSVESLGPTEAFTHMGKKILVAFAILWLFV